MLIKTLCLLPLLAANLDYCAAQTSPPANDWVAYRNCRERLQQSLDAGELTTATYSDNLKIECDNHLAAFTPDPTTPTGAGTR
jgi:hypothetical protein